MRKTYQRVNNCLTSSKIAVLAVLFYMISMLPILILSFYNHPSADDFNYGVMVHHVVVSGGGLLEIIKAACSTVNLYYHDWQGTFSAIFFFALQPGTFSESSYFLTTFILLGVLSVSAVVFMQTVYCRLMGGQKSHALILAVLVLFLQVQKVYSDTDAFYWFNGASYYTLFYSFSLLLLSVTAVMVLRPGTDVGENTHSKNHFLWIVSGTLLAVLVGGGNYSTALCTSIIMILLTAGLIYKKHPAGRRVFLLTAVLTISFLISVLAPGNAVRASSISQSYSPLIAILLSLREAAHYLRGWLQIPQVIVFSVAGGCCFLLTPIPEKIHFRHPVWFTIVAFGIYASQLTPPLYAMASVGEARQINIYYYSFYWLVLCLVFYWVSWYKEKHQALVCSMKSFHDGSCRTGLVLVCVLLLGYNLVNIDDLHISRIDMSSARALCALINGSVEDYDQAYRQRIELLNTPSEICYLPSLPECPPFRSDLVAEDPRYWVNYGMAQYYQHEEIILVSDKVP